MTTIDTAPRKVTDLPKDNARMIASRPVHALNDVLVTLRDGARAEPLYKDGAAVLGGSSLRGYVWAVKGDRAIVDFGKTTSGYGLRVVAAIADLVSVA